MGNVNSVPRIDSSGPYHWQSEVRAPQRIEGRHLDCTTEVLHRQSEVRAPQRIERRHIDRTTEVPHWETAPWGTWSDPPRARRTAQDFNAGILFRDEVKDSNDHPEV